MEEHTICAKANELWNRFLETKNEDDRDNFTNHVLNCEYDYIDVKTGNYAAADPESKGYTEDEIKEIEKQLHDIGIWCTVDSAFCNMCNHEIECYTVFLKFDEKRSS